MRSRSGRDGPSMKQHTRAWLLWFILLGLGASLTSLYVQYQILRDPTYRSFCDFNEVFNCERAYGSRFATFRSLPVALGEVIWFTLALLLTLASHPKSGRGEAETAPYLFSMSMPAFSVVVFQVYASIVVLRAVSIWSIVTYVAVLAIFLISGASATAPLSDLPRLMLRDTRALATRPIALGVALLFLAAAASAVAFFPRSVGEPTAAVIAALAQQPTDFDLWFESQERTPLALPTDGARVLIVKFNDYQCAACAETYKTEGAVLAKHQAAAPGKITFLVKDYPQDPECNSNVAETVHEAACEAAVAVRLAERNQRGRAMEEWLYAHQTGLTPTAVRQAAKDIGGVSDFGSEYLRVVALIKSDVDAGRRLGVRAPPTFFINGVKIEGALKADFLDQAIAHELRVTAKR